jgi:dienelactone hydrolase
MLAIGDPTASDGTAEQVDAPCAGRYPVGVAQIQAPLLFFYGGRDAVFTPENVDALEAKLQSLGKAHRVMRYPKAGHAYFNPRRCEYDEQASIQSWRELTAFLAEHLTGVSAIDRGVPVMAAE